LDLLLQLRQGLSELEDLGLLQTISFPNAGEPLTGNVLVP
jgi:hypothetical protein